LLIFLVLFSLFPIAPSELFLATIELFDKTFSRIIRKICYMSNLRYLFPFFQKRKNFVYLDSAGTSLKPQLLIDAIVDYYQNYSINTHSSNSPFFLTTQRKINEARELIAQWIKASSSEEIIFLPSSTYALNILALSLENFVEKDDQIALSYLEHSSNFYPWQALAKKKKTKIIFLPLKEDLVIDNQKLSAYITSRTKIVALTHLTNNLGIINPIAKIAKKIKKINPRCLIIVDAAQSIAHLPINVQEWNIDALIFSGHKVYGPTGIGILWLKADLGRKLPDLLWGGGKEFGINQVTKKLTNFSLSQKFEVGTLPLAQIFGLRAVFEWLSNFDRNKIKKQEKELWNYACQELETLAGITIYNQNFSQVSNIILCNFKQYHAHDIVDYLSRNNIFVRAGNFCSPFLKKLIGTESALRISLTFYNNKNDIDRLVFLLKKLSKKPELII